MMSTLEGRMGSALGYKAKMRCYQTQGLEGWQVFWTSNHYFFIKENWVCVMTIHHAESNNALLTRDLLFESDIGQ